MRIRFAMATISQHSPSGRRRVLAHRAAAPPNPLRSRVCAYRSVIATDRLYTVEPDTAGGNISSGSFGYV